MRCPTIDELPPPPAGRTGWPWTVGAPVVEEAAAPAISVVVPSYQQGAFLEETLRSILLQGHPALELLVMDGGSTDDSVAIIRRYERWIKAWVSERDGGQSAAINKGWRQAGGTWLTWLNSDDLLMPGWALEMTRALVAQPDTDLAFCDVAVIDRDSREQWIYRGTVPTLEQMVIYWKTTFAQQGFLVKRATVDTCGDIDESLHFTMDSEYWLRLLVAGRKFLHVPLTLGAFRVHEAAKTTTHHQVHVANMIQVANQFCDTAPPALTPLAARARRRLYWNVAHAQYDGRKHPEARRAALRHLREDGWKALPRVGAMVALSLLGDRGHDLLVLSRRLRGATSG
jgi:GT2 family glycosyltransferase